MRKFNNNWKVEIEFAKCFFLCLSAITICFTISLTHSPKSWKWMHINYVFVAGEKQTFYKNVICVFTNLCVYRLINVEWSYGLESAVKHELIERKSGVDLSRHIKVVIKHAGGDWHRILNELPPTLFTHSVAIIEFYWITKDATN